MRIPAVSVRSLIGSGTPENGPGEATRPRPAPPRRRRSRTHSASGRAARSVRGSAARARPGKAPLPGSGAPARARAGRRASRTQRVTWPLCDALRAAREPRRFHRCICPVTPLAPTMLVVLLVGVLLAAPAPKLTVSTVSKPAALTAGSPWQATVRVRRGSTPVAGARVSCRSRKERSSARSPRGRRSRALPGAGRVPLAGSVDLRGSDRQAKLPPRRGHGPGTGRAAVTAGDVVIDCRRLVRGRRRPRQPGRAPHRSYADAPGEARVRRRGRAEPARRSRRGDRGAARAANRGRRRPDDRGRQQAGLRRGRRPCDGRLARAADVDRLRRFRESLHHRARRPHPPGRRRHGHDHDLRRRRWRRGSAATAARPRGRSSTGRMASRSPPTAPSTSATRSTTASARSLRTGRSRRSPSA